MVLKNLFHQSPAWKGSQREARDTKEDEEIEGERMGVGRQTLPAIVLPE